MIHKVHGKDGRSSIHRGEFFLVKLEREIILLPVLPDHMGDRLSRIPDVLIGIGSCHYRDLVASLLRIDGDEHEEVGRFTSQDRQLVKVHRFTLAVKEFILSNDLHCNTFCAVIPAAK